ARGGRAGHRAVVDLAVAGGVDIESVLADRAGGGVQADRIVAAGVTVVDRVGGDLERAAVGAEDVVGGEGLAQAGDRVTGLHAGGGRGGRRAGGAVVDLAVGRGVDVQAVLVDGARSGVHGHAVVPAGVAVVDRVGGDLERAAVGPQHVLGLERLAQAGDRVRAVQRPQRRGLRGGGRPVVDLAVTGGIEVQAALADRARGRVRVHRVVVAAVAVVDRVARDLERAVARPQYMPRGESLGEPGDGIAVQRAHGRRLGRRAGAVVDLAVRDRIDIQVAGRDRARGGVQGNAIVTTAVAVVDGVAGDLQRAAIGAQHVAGSVGLAQAGYGVAGVQSAHGRRLRARGRA